MNVSKVFSVNFIGFLLLLFCLVHEAFSRKCYWCTSYFEKDCATNAQQERLIFDCGTRGLTPNNTHIKVIEDGEDYIACHLKVSMYEGVVVTERYCSRKEVSCEEVAEASKGLAEMIWCKSCTTDLCNGESIYDRENAINVEVGG